MATNREIFKTAHAIARRGVARFGGSYAVAFAAALRIAYQESKTMTTQYSIKSTQSGNEIAFDLSDLVPPQFHGGNQGALRALLKAKAEAAALASVRIDGASLIVTCHEKLRTNEKNADGKRIWIPGNDPRVINKFIDSMQNVRW